MSHPSANVPASGFFEWTGGKGAKQPHLFTAADGSPLLSFAGLWDRWKDPASGEWVLSCTIIEPGVEILRLQQHRHTVVIGLHSQTTVRAAGFSAQEHQLAGKISVADKQLPHEGRRVIRVADIQPNIECAPDPIMPV
jgi:putative SOS response-associated peptidase YedK